MNWIQVVYFKLKLKLKPKKRARFLCNKCASFVPVCARSCINATTHISGTKLRTVIKIFIWSSPVLLTMYMKFNKNWTIFWISGINGLTLVAPKLSYLPSASILLFFLVHRSSSLRWMCPAQFHFIWCTVSSMSLTFVCSLIQLASLQSCSLRPIIDRSCALCMALRFIIIFWLNFQVSAP